MLIALSRPWMVTIRLMSVEASAVTGASAGLKRKELEDADPGQVKEAVDLVKPKKVKAEDWSPGDSEYYIQNGLRKVYPYRFVYSTYAKGRWLNRKLFDVIQAEFRPIPKESLTKRFQSGELKVNGKVVSYDYVLKNNDGITNIVHRHELPVLAAPMKIIHESKDILVIDKPPSIPVHPCGRYSLNSVTGILRKEFGYTNPFITYRLDRLTSGVLIFAKTLHRAQKIIGEIRDRQVTKEYLCRVEGNFPDEEITCDEPIEIISHKIGCSIVNKIGKPCSTTFKKVRSDGRMSLVLCKPKTGRTHQIRVHLQYLGYPIENDFLYNSTVFGPNKGKMAEYSSRSVEELREAIQAAHNVSVWLSDPSDDIASLEPNVENSKPSKEGENLLTEGYFDLEQFPTDLREKYKFDEKKYKYEENCEECKIVYKEPGLENMLIYLHALRYKGSDWEFETDEPFWAK